MVERFSISSAPMDGTRIRLFHEEDQHDSDKFPTLGHFDGQQWVMNRFFVFARGKQLFMGRVPTHWAPLPADGFRVEVAGEAYHG